MGSGRKHNSDGLHFGFPTSDEIRWSITLQSAFQTQETPRVGKERGGTQGFQQPVGNRYEKYSCTGHPARRTTELPQEEPTPSSATLGHSLLSTGAVSSVCIFVRVFKAVFQSMNYNARDLGLSFIPAPNHLSKPQLPHR